jgi:hypothetical protein
MIVLFFGKSQSQAHSGVHIGEKVYELILTVTR